MPALAQHQSRREPMRMQLTALTPELFPRFSELLRYRDWCEDCPESPDMPPERAQQMLELSLDVHSGCKVWLITKQEDLRHIGVVTIMPIFHAACRQLAYWVEPEFHSQGYATLAVKAVTQFCFEHTPVVRIQAQCLLDNPASIKVLEKNNYTKEAEMPASHQRGQEFIPSLLYAKVRSDHKPSREAGN